jgi:hypothetical protein
MEPALLQSAALDALAAASGRHCAPLRGLPLQFRELQIPQEEFLLASSDSRGTCAEKPGAGGRLVEQTNPAQGGIWGSDAITGRARSARYGGRDKKWFQVTLRQLVIRPACTVTTWHPELVRREPFAPHGWFSPTADQCAGARPLPIPVEARFSMRPFALQYRGLVSQPIPVTASTFPAYIFETILRSDLARSAPRSRSRSAFYGLPGTIHTRNPLPDPTSGLTIRIRALAPLRDFSIPRDQSPRPGSEP